MTKTLQGNETGLVAYYPFDEGTAGTVIADKTTPNYDGTFIENNNFIKAELHQYSINNMLMELVNKQQANSTPFSSLSHDTDVVVMPKGGLYSRLKIEPESNSSKNYSIRFDGTQHYLHMNNSGQITAVVNKNDNAFWFFERTNDSNANGYFIVRNKANPQFGLRVSGNTIIGQTVPAIGRESFYWHLSGAIPSIHFVSFKDKNGSNCVTTRADDNLGYGKQVPCGNAPNQIFGLYPLLSTGIRNENWFLQYPVAIFEYYRGKLVAGDGSGQYDIKLHDLGVSVDITSSLEYQYQIEKKAGTPYYQIINRKSGEAWDAGWEWKVYHWTREWDNARQLFELLPVMESRPPATRASSENPNYAGEPYQPERFNDHNIPDDTQEVFIGEIVVPFFMVDDPANSKEQQIQEYPFYILERQKFWRNAMDHHHLGTSDWTNTESETIGLVNTTSHTITETTSITATAEAGIEYKGASASLGVTAGYELQEVNSKTTGAQEQTTTTYSMTLDSEDEEQHIVVWFLVNRYVLYRKIADNKFKVSEMEIIDSKKIRQTRYPPTREGGEDLTLEDLTEKDSTVVAAVLADCVSPLVDANMTVDIPCIIPEESKGSESYEKMRLLFTNPESLVWTTESQKTITCEPSNVCALLTKNNFLVLDVWLQDAPYTAILKGDGSGQWEYQTHYPIPPDPFLNILEPVMVQMDD